MTEQLGDEYTTILQENAIRNPFNTAAKVDFDFWYNIGDANWEGKRKKDLFDKMNYQEYLDTKVKKNSEHYAYTTFVTMRFDLFGKRLNKKRAQCFK